MEGRSKSILLDFGCGVGATEEVLRKVFPKTTLVGVDISMKMLKLSQKLKINNAFYTLAGYSLPFRENSFDFIYCNGTFHHLNFSEHFVILKEFYRVLKQSGSLFLFENNPYNLYTRWAMKHIPFDKNARLCHPAYLIKLAKKAGFCIRQFSFLFFFPRSLRGLRFLESRLKWCPLGAQYCLSFLKVR